jgi:hypothetical protein
MDGNPTPKKEAKQLKTNVARVKAGTRGDFRIAEAGS